MLVAALFALRLLHAQARMVRAAVEDALQGLKSVLPAVMADRRGRSLMRAVPCVAKAVAGGRSGRGHHCG